MPLPTSVDPDAILAKARDAAREAAAFVHTGWRTRPHADSKRGATDLVTYYDRESERLLRARLSAETPFAIVGEELGPPTPGSSAEAVWYVDPIDGTTNFVHGHPFYCVSIGLVAGGAPALGVVVAPALGVEWTGVVGRGATRGGKACEVSGVLAFEGALLATGFPYDRSKSPENNFDAFVHIKRRVQAVRRCGSAALDLCLVADGTYDGYWERNLGAWDLAGGAAIVLAAGGRISDFAGRTPDVTRGNLVASNGRIHDALVRALADAGGAPPPGA
jgi:myo-inositol-1(or 4)-monophosphatase